MNNQDIFIREVLVDKVKVKPQMLGNNITQILNAILTRKYAGVCSHHGYIRPNSIEVVKHSVGNLLSVSFNGDVLYSVCFKADVCNPMIGSKVFAKIINMNKFGILAETGIIFNNKVMPILEIIVAKQTVDMNSLINLETLNIGDVVTVEILGKKYELTDTKISIVGRIIAKGNLQEVIHEEDVDVDELDADDGVDIIPSEDTEDDDESKPPEEEEKGEKEESEEESEEDEEDDGEDDGEDDWDSDEGGSVASSIE